VKFLIFEREYFPTDFNLFNNSASLILFFLFIAFFVLGFFIIYRQVALVKKGEFRIKDRLQCTIYGFIFSSSIMIVIGMAFIFAVKTPSFWENSPTPPPNINPLWLIFPLLICLGYIAIYPLIDFLFIALSKESDEGLTPFHKFIGDHWINKFESKPLRILMAILLYLFFIIPPFLLWAIGLPFIMILITWLLVYPLMILTFYGAKGYIAGISNVYYHLPDLKRSIFLSFEDGKRAMKEFAADPGPRILLGLMLFVYVWAWISMIQTLAFYFTGKMAISTYSYAGMVFVTLLFGIIGYFTRFWGRKIKYRGIDIYFAGYLMAAVGINVLANFMIVNPEKLYTTFDYTIIGMHELIPNYLLFAFAAVIEEIVLIVFTTYFFLAKDNKFTENIKFSKITECGQTFDPIPLFNFIKSDNKRIQKYAEETILLMFERIPLKSEINLNNIKYKHSLLDGISDPHPNAQRICYKILVQLEKDVPEIILPWIIESLNSPNYDKSVPIAKSLLNADLNLVEKIPENYIFSLIEDSEWRLKLIGLKIIHRLIKKNKNLILNLDVNELVNDANSKVQVEILNILAKSSVLIPIETIIDKLNHSNREIRAAAIRNIKNLKPENINIKIISKIIPLMRDPSSDVRAAIFEVFSKVGNFRKFFIPILPILDGLIDKNKKVREASILAIEKYFDEEPGSINIDLIINKIDVSDDEILNSIITLLGRLWEKDPEKILTTLLIFIKFDNEQLKENISKILVNKYRSYHDLILKNLIRTPDVSKFITKGIVAKTIINIAKQNPQKVIPTLLNYLQSENQDIKLNAIVSLDGLVDDYVDMIKLKPFLILLQKDTNQQIKKEVSKVISKIAKKNPMSIKPVMSVILQSINQQEPSVKIVLAKSLLQMAIDSPDIVPIRPIINFLSDEDSFIRESGANILGFIGKRGDEFSKEIAEALLNKGLNDSEWNVREAAVSSLGRIIEYIPDKNLIIKKVVALLDDEQVWVQRSAMNLLSNVKNIKASQIPFEKLSKSLTSKDPKVREASVGLLKVYANQIDRIFDKILSLLEDESETVRENTIIAMVNIIENIGIEKILSKLLKNLSDEGSIEIQRSIALILGKTVKYKDEKIKKRVISLLKIRCEMSQDPIICETLAKLKEN